MKPHNNKLPVIAMFSVSSKITDFQVNCASAACYYQCEYLFFTKEDIDIHKKTIAGNAFIEGKWIKKKYNYKNDIDAIYDRLRGVGLKKYKEIYDELKHIPITHSYEGRQMNKLDLYNIFSNNQELSKHILAYSFNQGYKSFELFIKKYNPIIIKPVAGAAGNNLYLIEKVAGKYLIDFKNNSLKLNELEMKDWFSSNISDKDFVFQEYLLSRTKDNQPFDIRVHMMRNITGNWRFVALLPRIGIEKEKITPMLNGGYIGILGGFIKRNYDIELKEKIITEIKNSSLKMVTAYEKEHNIRLAEAGIDLGINKEGDIYMFEINIRKPGMAYYQFKVAQAGIGYAKYLAMKK